MRRRIKINEEGIDEKKNQSGPAADKNFMRRRIKLKIEYGIVNKSSWNKPGGFFYCKNPDKTGCRTGGK